MPDGQPNSDDETVQGTDEDDDMEELLLEDSACGSMEISAKDVLPNVPSAIDIPQRAVSITVDSTSTVALPPSPDADAAISQEESPPTIETPELGRGKRKRKARDIGDLSQCLCGNSISFRIDRVVRLAPLAPRQPLMWLR
ncbi:hypothetical protein C8J57DRAFT_1500877 [Mycena rebaudengoi]|nr:hypothetical protein C8J57DRAFT_1500877 [Mycena rebaudengoi]